MSALEVQTQYNLPINNDTSNLQEKQPSDENTETNKIEEITTPGNEISESNVWTGTVREAEIAFQTKLIEGIDTVFDRKTDRRFSGKMEIVDSSGVKKGELELVNGRMNGEELFTKMVNSSKSIFGKTENLLKYSCKLTILFSFNRIKEFKMLIILHFFFPFLNRLKEWKMGRWNNSIS